jgi:hypothetical protein
MWGVSSGGEVACGGNGGWKRVFGGFAAGVMVGVVATERGRGCGWMFGLSSLSRLGALDFEAGGSDRPGTWMISKLVSMDLWLGVTPHSLLTGSLLISIARTRTWLTRAGPHALCIE